MLILVGPNIKTFTGRTTIASNISFHGTKVSTFVDTWAIGFESKIIIREIDKLWISDNIISAPDKDLATISVDIVVKSNIRTRVLTLRA